MVLPTDDEEPSSAVVTVYRPPGGALPQSRAIKLSVDGEHRAAVRSGATCDLPVASGWHRFQARFGSRASNEVELYLPPGDTLFLRLEQPAQPATPREAGAIRLVRADSAQPRAGEDISAEQKARIRRLVRTGRPITAADLPAATTLFGAKLSLAQRTSPLLFLLCAGVLLFFGIRGYLRHASGAIWWTSSTLLALLLLSGLWGIWQRSMLQRSFRRSAGGASTDGSG